MLSCWDAATSSSQHKITSSATHFTKLIANRNQRASAPANPVLELVLTLNFSHRTCPGWAEVALLSLLSLLLPSSSDAHCPESKEVQQPRSSEEAGIHVWGINTLLRGPLEWSVPSPSHNCCTDLSSPCWCTTLMQPGPAVGSHTCWPGAPAARDQMGLTGCPAVVASAAHCDLATPYASSATTAKPKLQLTVLSLKCTQQGFWGEKQVWGWGEVLSLEVKEIWRACLRGSRQQPYAGCPKAFDVYSHKYLLHFGLKPSLWWPLCESNLVFSRLLYLCAVLTEKLAYLNSLQWKEVRMKKSSEGRTFSSVFKGTIHTGSSTDSTTGLMLVSFCRTATWKYLTKTELPGGHCYPISWTLSTQTAEFFLTASKCASPITLLKWGQLIWMGFFY